MSSSSTSEQQSMGALFQKRRAAAAAKQQHQSNNNNKSGSNDRNNNPPSSLELQAEQGREQRRNPSHGSSHYESRPRGGGGLHNTKSSGHRGAERSGGVGGRRSRNQQQPNRSNLPVEQGAICSLKESFGFIRCAERPDEIFFHYSELQNTHPGDIKSGDEVEFRVGSSSSRGGGGRGGDRDSGDKLAAYHVQTLPEGTVVWETEDDPGHRVRGLVERPVRTDRNGNNTGDGTVRLVLEKEGEDENDAPTMETAEAAPDSPLIRFTGVDYQMKESSGAGEKSGGRGGSRRHPARLSRGDLVEFSLVTERRSKDKFARKITLIMSERERARLQEEKRMLEAASVEHGVVTAIKGEYGFLKSNKRREEVYFHQSNLQLENVEAGNEGGTSVIKEGQEVKFLVVEDGGDTSNGARRRASARRVQIQPRGSVKFYDLLATGMTGVVTLCPQPIDSGHALEAHGKIRLTKPLMDRDENGEKVPVDEVYLRTKDSPGGTFPFRGGASVGLWIEIGDTLLFDVVKDFVDGACRAIPTNYTTAREDPANITEEVDDRTDYNDADKSDQFPRAVRMVSLSLAGRAEGIINTVKDSFGFIHFSERPVDAHFKLFQLLPDELQLDLRRAMGLSDLDDHGKPLQLTAGSEVQFDLSVHGTIHSSAHMGRNRGRTQQSHERENLKAQRILLLPPKTICQEYVLASGVKGVVTKEDPKQPYAGTLDLESPVKTASLQERHPLVSKLISLYLQSGMKTPLIFHDIQSVKEDDTVMNMAELLGEGRLSCSHIPDPDEPAYPGRLYIQEVGREGPQSSKSAEVSDNAKESNTTDDEGLAENEERSSKTPKKKKPAKAKTVKTIRFDKSSLVPELKEDLPPAVGDVGEFNIVQSRRTGQSSVSHMKLVERHVPEVSVTDNTEFGVVKEVVAARKFGFISLMDEAATSREVLFFSFSNVVPPDLSLSITGKSVMLRRGDEVKFNIGTEKNGKRIALNVTVLPRGTIPNKADKNACRGYLLMAPSHTSLKAGTLRQASSTHPQGGDKSSRWEGVEEDRKQKGSEEPITEQGCILLLDDPTGMFKLTPRGASSQEINATIQTGNENDAPLKQHLRYKVGAIAIHGSGSSTEESSHPRRGDIVSFVSGKGGSGPRDIRLESRGAAELLRGRLEGISFEPTEGGTSAGRAKFIAASEEQQAYDVDLSEVISCDASVLKEKESVEGILHEGSIYGICRTVDLYLETKHGSSLDSRNGAARKERPRLNLTVKKDRGGKIMAQSMMAKGPDGTNGFAPGWTSRISMYVTCQDEAVEAPANENTS